MSLNEFHELARDDTRRARPLEEGALSPELYELLTRSGSSAQPTPKRWLALLGWGSPVRRTSLYEHSATESNRIVRVLQDDRFAALCESYASADPGLRQSIRGSVSDATADDLLTFAWRSAIFCLRDQDAEWIRRGALANAVENASFDARDNITSLQALHYAAVESVLEPLNLFRSIRGQAGPAIARILDVYFLECPPSSVGRGFEFRRIDTPFGPSLMSSA